MRAPLETHPSKHISARKDGGFSGLADGAGDVVAVLNFGLPGQLVYAASILFLEALNRPGPGLVIMIAANFVNAVLNWLLIDGDIALGAEGAAWATTISRWLIAAAAVIYILRMKDILHNAD